MRHQSIEDPDLSLDVLMSLWPQTLSVFLRHKMLCVGCLVNPFHTVIEACHEYNLDEASFRAELQAVVDA
jgi:hybrid cluster-associated redox disulfide protein